MATKYIFVTGGVVSGLGKGITAASLGRLLKTRGLKVASQKLDPYINVDPGTMSPLQHGEVFVTDDGTETDLDLGHYERFTDENLNKYSNLTTGKVYWNVLHKERQGAYLGQTVQIIPHITNEIKSYIYNLAKSTEADVVITEIGGTTGDIESQPFLEAIRRSGWNRALKTAATSTWCWFPTFPARMSINPSRPSIPARSCRAWVSSRTSSCCAPTARLAPTSSARSACSAMCDRTASSKT